MVVKEISPTNLLVQARAAFGLPHVADPIIDAAFLAAAVRRAAGHSTPCSSSRLRRIVFESLNVFSKITPISQEGVDDAIDDALVTGDLLELSQVTTEDVGATSTWVFPAPFSFVPLQSGRILIMGIVRDQNSPLSEELNARIKYNGPFRSIRSELDENLAVFLKEIGVIEISENAWLKAPAQSSAPDRIHQLQIMVDALSPAGEVNGIEVLDWARSPDRYWDRWTVQTGKLHSYYVARRPQAFGPPLWGFARFDHGVLSKFLDFPLKGDRWRGCDIAWHLQMAIDANLKRPQTYRMRDADGFRIIDLFSPIPIWANRRMLSTGELVGRRNSLFSFRFSLTDAPDIETFLQNRLWLHRTI